MNLIFFLVAAGVAVAGIVAFVADRRKAAAVPIAARIIPDPTGESETLPLTIPATPKTIGVKEIAYGVFLGLLMWSVFAAALYWLLK